MGRRRVTGVLLGAVVAGLTGCSTLDVMSSMPPARLSVFLGHILEEATPAERAAFLDKLPEGGRQAFQLVGEPTYRREVAELRRGI